MGVVARESKALAEGSPLTTTTDAIAAASDTRRGDMLAAFRRAETAPPDPVAEFFSSTAPEAGAFSRRVQVERAARALEEAPEQADKLRALGREALLTEYQEAARGRLSLRMRLVRKGFSPLILGNPPRGSLRRSLSGRLRRAGFDPQEVYSHRELPPIAGKQGDTLSRQMQERILAARTPEERAARTEEYLTLLRRPARPLASAINTTDSVGKQMAANVAKVGTEVAASMDNAVGQAVVTGKIPPVEVPELTGKAFLADVVRLFAKNSVLADWKAYMAAERLKRSLDLTEDVGRDLIAFHDGTPNPWIPEDTVGAVVSRLSKHPKWKELQELVARNKVEWSQELVELNTWRVKIGKEELSPVANWIHHSWVPGARSIFRPSRGSRFRLFESVEKERRFPTTYAGVQAGWVPRVTHYADMMALSQSLLARAQHSKRLLSSLLTHNIFPDTGKLLFQRFAFADDIPRGYTEVTSQALDAVLPGEGAIAILDEAVPYLKGLFSDVEYGAVAKVAALHKNFGLSWSFFHPATLTEASSLIGPVKGLGVSARLGFGLPTPGA
ncbi:MAG: hypothetical protein L0170_06100, partial [Acidobacteria bacterium]|nr:hypothetical protein [Acidobacteriota bacterium]